MIFDWMNRVVGVVSEVNLFVKIDYFVVNFLGNNEGYIRINSFFLRLLVSKNLIVFLEK